MILEFVCGFFVPDRLSERSPEENSIMTSTESPCRIELCQMKSNEIGRAHSTIGE
jgi:hypothetical protein